MWIKRLRILSKYVWIGFIILIISSTTTILIYQKQYMPRNEKLLFEILEIQNFSDFLINTTGCQIPNWDPWDPSVKQFYEPNVWPYKCSGRPSFLIVSPNGIIVLDKTILQFYYEVEPEALSCHYQPIYRAGSINNFSIDFNYKLGPLRKLEFYVPLNVDFMKVECELLGTTEPTFVEYLTLTPLKQHVESKKVVRKRLNFFFNVMLIGIDSISRFQFIRHFPKCLNYLKNRSGTFHLKGYTKVGDNTFPNLMPLLTGHFYEHYWDENLNRTMYFDDVDFIWKEFDEKGYRTFYAEDAPNINTFNYYRSGFKNPPTHYYYRPFALAVEEKPLKQCIGNKMEIQVIYDYLKNFAITMNQSRPFFSFTFLARMTHDFLNQAGYVDEPTFQVLKFLDDSKISENTIVILFSDHGMRYGPIRKTYIGQFEERMPFMYLIFPKWFPRKFPYLAANLKENENRLTTPFDIHATLMDVVNFTSSRKRIESPGISLFETVPSNRTCQSAWISPHWCTCRIKDSFSVTTNDKIVIKASICVVNTINKWLKNFTMCSTLKLKTIHSARSLSSNLRVTDSNIKNLYFTDFLVVISTVPGFGFYESTVRCNHDCKVLGDISRINRYGNQSICIDNVHLKKYCFCLHL